MHKVTKADFLRWLAQQADDAYVGEKATNCGCPLAYYLMASHHAVMPHIGTHSYTLDGNWPAHWRRTADWMQRLIGHVDSLPGDKGRLIRADELRALLAGMVPAL